MKIQDPYMAGLVSPESLPPWSADNYVFTVSSLTFFLFKDIPSLFPSSFKKYKIGQRDSTKVE